MKPPIASYGAFANLASIAAFADVGVIDVAAYRTKHFVFVGATNTMSVQVLGSIDGGVTFPFTEHVAFDVASGATVTKTSTTPYTHMKVQVQDKVGGVHGTLTTRWFRSQW